MKRWIVALIVVGLLSIPAFFVAVHFTERRRQTNNVRHHAQWFATALKTGNERAASNYLARPKMDFTALEKALYTHAKSMLTTDFDTAPVTFRSDGSTLLATFQCSGQAALTFYSEDGGDVWRIAELKSQ
jgi:hypothetical protein